MKSIIDTYEWQTKSLCKNELKFDSKTKTFVPYTEDDFFPRSGKTVTTEVKELCDRCPVEAECLEFALTFPEKFGYWGGKSEKQREKIRQQQNIISLSNKQQQVESK